MKRKNSLRLPDFDYCGPFTYFVTCSTYKREQYFLVRRPVHMLLNLMRETGLTYGFTESVYCFMPDHLHMLLEGKQDSKLQDYMKIFKQTSALSFKREFNKILWQRSYYERILRRDENLENVALYILNNPVRAGIVDDFIKYPYLGSSTFDLDMS